MDSIFSVIAIVIVAIAFTMYFTALYCENKYEKRYEYKPERAISWDFIVGLIKVGMEPRFIAQLLDHNDRADPGWRFRI